MPAMDRMLDAGLSALVTEADRVFLCSSAPSDYTTAVQAQLGAKAGTRGAMFEAITGVNPGRRTRLVAFYDGAVSGTGTATHIAIGDSLNTRLLFVQALPAPVDVIAGRNFALNPFNLTLGGVGNIVLTATGLTVSSPTIASPTLSSSVAGPGWYNTSEPAQSGSFTVEFDAIPSNPSLDVLVGLSNGAAAAYSDMACILLFNLNNQLQVRNGGSYAASTTMGYTPGVTYHVRMLVNVTNHTYSVYVTPQGQAETLLAAGYSFRTEQNTVTQLNNLAVNNTAAGSVAVGNFIMGRLDPANLNVTQPILGKAVLNGLVGLTANGINVSPLAIGLGVTGNFHGQDVTVNNTGRAGAALTNQPNYSATLTTQGATTISSGSPIYRNVNFTGVVTIAGGSPTFEYCKFSVAPPYANSAVIQYNGGLACGNATFNWCDFDSGLRTTQGNFETAGFQAGQRGTANPETVGRGSSFHLYRCSVQGYGNGVCIHKWQNNAPSEVVECCITNLTTGGGSHTDGIEYYSSDNVLIQRCRIVLDTLAGHQSCLNIAPMDIDFPNVGNPINIWDNYIDGGIAPILCGYGVIKQVSFIGNRYGDSSEYGRECDFNSMDVTYDQGWAQANTQVTYWAPSNVWAPNGEGVTNPATAPSGDVPAGRPHTPGGFVSAANFFAGATWIWNGNLVGPTGPVTFTANNLTVGSPVLPSPALNNRVGFVANNLTVSSPVLGVASWGSLAWPDRTNTGYQSAPGYTSLTNWGGGSIQSNTTYNFIDFGSVDVGSRDVAVSNVTFFGCRFHGSGDGAIINLYGDNITFDYCTFEPDGVTWPISSQVSHTTGYWVGLNGNGAYYAHIAKLTVTHCDFWGFAMAIDVNGSTQAKPHTFKHNWFHDARNDGGGVDHTNGLWCQNVSSCSYVWVEHNTIESVGNTQGISSQGSSGSSTADHITIINNKISGWGYGIALIGNVTNLTFTDNVFSTRLACAWGPLYDTFGTGLLWRRNKWEVPAGAAWGTPANNGKYWMPVAGASQNDNTFVSSTDYTG